MKTLTLLSLAAATLLFTACGEQAKEAAADAANKVTEVAKESTASVVDATKETAAKAAQAAKEKAAEVAAAAKAEAEATAKAAAEKAAQAAETLKVRAAAVTAPVADAPAEPAAFAKCKGCHGADGKTKALGKSAVLAGQEKAALIEAIKGYQAGTRNVAGMGMLMKGQVAGMNDADIEAVAEYLSKK